MHKQSLIKTVTDIVDMVAGRYMHLIKGTTGIRSAGAAHWSLALVLKEKMVKYSHRPYLFSSE